MSTVIIYFIITVNEDRILIVEPSQCPVFRFIRVVVKANENWQEGEY